MTEAQKIIEMWNSCIDDQHTEADLLWQVNDVELKESDWARIAIKFNRKLSSYLNEKIMKEFDKWTL